MIIQSDSVYSSQVQLYKHDWVFPIIIFFSELLQFLLLFIIVFTIVFFSFAEIL